MQWPTLTSPWPYYFLNQSLSASPGEKQLQFPILDHCLTTKACGLLLKTHHPTKGGGENVLQRGGKTPPLSSAPIFHSPVEKTKRPKDVRKHSLRYKKNMLTIREEQGHLGGKKLTPAKEDWGRRNFLKNREYHSFCSKAGTLNGGRAYSKEKKWYTEERSSETSMGCHVFYGKFALFVFLNLWTTSRLAIYFQREAWNFPGLSFAAFLKTTFFPVRLAHSRWLMCTSPSIPALQDPAGASASPCENLGHDSYGWAQQLLGVHFAVSAAGMGKASP